MVQLPKVSGTVFRHILGAVSVAAAAMLMNCLPFDFGDSTGTQDSTDTQDSTSDRDSTGTLQFKSAAYSVAEADATVRIYVSRADGSSGAASVDYATSDGTALAGSDYTAASGTLSWADGDTDDKYVDIPILSDAELEGGETFTMTLSGAVGASLGSPNETVVRICAVVIETVTVAYPGNAPDDNSTADGAVDYTYRIAKYELTSGQYTAFLNLVAKTDTYELYNTTMESGAGITRTGTPGDYVYSVAEAWVNKPVSGMGGASAARFVNWLHNGQPAGDQDLSTTEDGSYYLNGATTYEQFAAVTRSPNATWVIPTRDEWYKAAHYDPAKPGGIGYWDYPTRSDDMPSGTIDPTGTNNANYTPCDGFDGDVCGGSLIDVGTLAGSPGPFGTFDQAGNVAEYTGPTSDAWSWAPCGGDYQPDLDAFMDVTLFSCNTWDSHVGLRVGEIPTIDPQSGGVVQFKPSAALVVEHEGTIRLEITRTDGSRGAASVQYATVDGTAVAGSDYGAMTGTLSWADGDTADKYFDIPVTNDADQEARETFTVTLYGATGAGLGTPAELSISILDDDVVIETVTIGDPGNAADTRYDAAGHGAVGYSYRIGKFEVTAGQYAAFLNAVARTDTYELYYPDLANTGYTIFDLGCHVIRSGRPGSYVYTVEPEWADRPANVVSWLNAARFANWLHNGQPTGTQDLTTTEDGSYYINGLNPNPPDEDYTRILAVTRKAGATWVIPTDNEWYKAAYYDPAKPGGAGYWDYPTRSNTLPSNVLDSHGTNNADYHVGDSWKTGYTMGPPYYRAEVGTFAASPSAYNTLDQAGNVSEWTEAIGPLGDCWLVRGGGWMYQAGLHANDPQRGLGEPSWVGFRLCEVDSQGSGD